MGGCSSFPGQCLFTLPMTSTTVLAILQRACVGWEGKKRKGQSRSKKKKKRERKTYPAGERDKDCQQLPSSRATAEPVRQRGQSTEAGKSQAQGGGAPPATLTQPKQATPSTTSSVKSSKAARPSGSCLGTWTMSQPKLPLAESPGLASRAAGTSPWLLAGQALVARKYIQLRTLHQEQGGRKGAGGDQEGGRLREKEAGLDQLPSPFPSPSPEVAAPPSPRCFAG